MSSTGIPMIVTWFFLVHALDLGISRIRGSTHQQPLLRAAASSSSLTSQNQQSIQTLFGGENMPWNVSDWFAVDDRVRGGKSQSYMSNSSIPHSAEFHGILDIRTLGGAGFASQRYEPNQPWNFLGTHGLEIEVENGDNKEYAFNIVTDKAATSPDGRTQSTLVYKTMFVGTRTKTIYKFAWSNFQASYRGRPVPSPPPMNLSHVYYLSIMMQSQFGKEEGQFSVNLRRISLY